MNLLITMIRDEDGVFVAKCPSIPGCVSQGNTEHEARRNIRLAVRECLAVRRARDQELKAKSQKPQ